MLAIKWEGAPNTNFWKAHGSVYRAVEMLLPSKLSFLLQTEWHKDLDEVSFIILKMRKILTANIRGIIMKGDYEIKYIATIKCFLSFQKDTTVC